MSNKSIKKVEDILDALCEYENVKSYNQLAPLLHYKPQAVYKWAQRGSIPVENLSKKRPDINKAFLMGKDAQIANKNYLEEVDLKSAEAKKLNREIEKYSSSNDGAVHDSPLERILLAFRSQLKAQKNQTETMIHYIEMVLSNHDN